MFYLCICHSSCNIYSILSRYLWVTPLSIWKPCLFPLCLVFKLLVCSHCFIGWQQVNNSWKNNSLEFNQNCKHLAASTSMVMPSDCLNIIHNEWMFHREQGPDIFLLWSVWNAPGIFTSMAQLACATCMKRQIVISWEMQHSLLSICLEASFVI